MDGGKLLTLAGRLAYLAGVELRPVQRVITEISTMFTSLKARLRYLPRGAIAPP